VRGFIPRDLSRADHPAGESLRGLPGNIEDKRMTTDCIELLGALTNAGIPLKQDALALSLWGPLGSVRRVQAACQEARLAGWPLVTSGTGVRLENIPAAVAECAAALRRRAITQLLTARALRRTAERMREPITLWEATG